MKKGCIIALVVAAVVITSPGKDGVLGNEDDVTSEMMKDLVEDAEASAEPAPEAPAPAP